SVLYVSDGNSIRRIDLASFAVTTVAGAFDVGSDDGPAASARFNGPGGVAFAGNSLFVADTTNRTIRQIDLATGLVSTLAGSPGQGGGNDGIGDQAQFDAPTGIAADGAGHLYVADPFGQTIRKIEIATREVTTLAGKSREAGLSGTTVADVRFDGPTGL